MNVEFLRYRLLGQAPNQLKASEILKRMEQPTGLMQPIFMPGRRIITREAAQMI